MRIWFLRALPPVALQFPLSVRWLPLTFRDLIGQRLSVEHRPLWRVTELPMAHPILWQTEKSISVTVLTWRRRSLSLAMRRFQTLELSSSKTPALLGRISKL